MRTLEASPLCFKVDGGNPLVKITDEILQDQQYSDDIHVINLPAYSNLGSADGVMHPVAMEVHGSALFL